MKAASSINMIALINMIHSKKGVCVKNFKGYLRVQCLVDHRASRANEIDEYSAESRSENLRSRFRSILKTLPNR